MMLLASLDNPGAAEIGGFLILVVAVLTILAKIGAAKKELVSTIITQLRGEQNPPAQNVGPQPFRVVGEKEYVLRPDFHKHAEINRSEHARVEAAFAAALLRVEQKTEENVRRIEQSVTMQGREISEIKALREANGETLNHMSIQISEVKDTVGELSGVIHQLVREGNHKK